MSRRNPSDEYEATDADGKPHFRDVTVQALDLADPLIPEAEAARILMISKWSLMRLRKRKKITYVVLLRSVFYRRSHLEKYISRCTVPSREPGETETRR